MAGQKIRLKAPRQSRRINWYFVHRGLFDKSQGRILPADVGRMTLAEVYVIITDEKDINSDGSPRQTPEEILEWARRLVCSSPLQRLEQYEEG